MSILDTPRTVDVSRITAILAQEDLSYSRDEENRVLLAFPSGVLSLSLSGLNQPNAELLQVIGRWRANAETEMASKLAAFALEANREIPLPKVVLITENDGDHTACTLGTSISGFYPSGMSDAQLRSFVTNSIARTLEMFKRAELTMPELKTWNTEE